MSARAAIIPPRIRAGETLGIVAPAGPVKPERLQRGLARLGDTFRLRVAESVTAPHPAGVPSYLSASDDVRAAELDAMIADPDVRAILLARGGYGLMRILPRLDASALARDPKPIIGFSDATAVLAWAYAAGVRGIHGPIAAQLGDLPDSDVARLVELMTDPRAIGPRPWSLIVHGRGAVHGRDAMHGRDAVHHRAAHTGARIDGPLVPGNLTLVSMLAGTPWPVPLAGAIALFEEVGERPYEIDRYLTQLALVGELGRAAAVVIGDLARCADPSPPAGPPDPPDAALRTVLERIAAAGLPAAVGAPIGHGDRNEAVPFGGRAILDLDAGTLELVDPAVV